ncbi:MAG: hypothetical protein ACTSVU_05500 [Promethearchaeota archaeon]
MDTESISNEYKSFQESHPGYGNIIILSIEGEILYTSDPDWISPDQAKNFMDAWLNNGPALILGEDRFSIINWFDLQFAAKNVRGKGAFVGSKTKLDHYVLAFLPPGSKVPLTVGAIEINRWVWDRV